MGCDTWLEAASARLDGELAAGEETALDQHLGRCPSCAAVVERLEALHRSQRLRPAPPVPDLTGAIVAAAGTPRRRSLVAAAVAVATTAAVAAVGGLALLGPGSRPASPPLVSAIDARALAGKAGGVSMVVLYLDNEGAGDRIVAASSPAAASVELHGTRRSGGVEVMDPLATVPVPDGGGTELSLAGTHVMLVGLRADLQPGDSLPLTLDLARSGPLRVEATVEADPRA